MTAAVASSSASSHGVAYGNPFWAAVKQSLAAPNASVRLWAIQGLASQASRRSTMRCCGGKAPVWRKYSCSIVRKSGNRRAMGPVLGW
jgi:hypothetical protein